MRILRSGFRRLISSDRRGGLFIAGVLSLGAAATAWTATSLRTWTDSNHAETADASQTRLSADRLERAVETSQAPRIELSTHRLDLGDGKPNEELRGELVVTNRSAEPLDFSVTTTCGCATPKPMQGTIEPDGRQTIELGVKLPDHANSEKNATVTVHTTAQRPAEPRPEAIACAVFARCPAPFAVSPSHVEFGTVSQKQLAGLKQEILVASVPGKPPVSSEKLQIELAHDAFEIVRSPSDVGAAAVQIRLAADLPFGDHFDNAELRLAGSDYVVRVPIHVRIAEPVSVVPAKAFLRKDPATQRFRPVTVLIVSRAAAGPVGRVRMTDGPSWLRVEDLGGEAAPQRRVRLLAVGDLAPSESVIRLAAGSADKELSLKLVVIP